MLYGPSICWFWSLSPHRFRPMDITAQALEAYLAVGEKVQHCVAYSGSLWPIWRYIAATEMETASLPCSRAQTQGGTLSLTVSCRHHTSNKLIHPQERVQRMVARMRMEGSGGETVFNHLSDISGTARGRKDSGPLQHISRGKGQGVRSESHNREA